MTQKPTDNPDYDKGYVDALRAYAHWNNGVEYVGTTGKTLKDALINRKLTFYYSPPKEK